MASLLGSIAKRGDQIRLSMSAYSTPHPTEMMRSTIFAATLVLAANPALAQFQVPGECTELATREGFPTDVLTKSQAARARVRMAQLSDRDPLVTQCRSAIRRAQAMVKEIEKSAAPASPTQPAD
jgi:hypothetical protein